MISDGYKVDSFLSFSKGKKDTRARSGHIPDPRRRSLRARYRKGVKAPGCFSSLALSKNPPQAPLGRGMQTPSARQFVARTSKDIA